MFEVRKLTGLFNDIAEVSGFLRQSQLPGQNLPAVIIQNTDQVGPSPANNPDLLAGGEFAASGSPDLFNNIVRLAHFLSP